MSEEAQWISLQVRSSCATLLPLSHSKSRRKLPAGMQFLSPPPKVLWERLSPTNLESVQLADSTLRMYMYWALLTAKCSLRQSVNYDLWLAPKADINSVWMKELCSQEATNGSQDPGPCILHQVIPLHSSASKSIAEGLNREKGANSSSAFPRAY